MNGCNDVPPPGETLVDQYSRDIRMSAEINAEIELSKLQKKDERYNDPMTAYKFIQERTIFPGL